MHKLYFLFSILFIVILSSSVSAQGIESEIGVGAQFTKALIMDYDVGIIGNQKPKNDRFLPGYTFNIVVRTTERKMQPGLQLKSDLVRHNVYLPVNFPSDYMSERQSRWEHVYNAYRLGLGGNLRINFNNLFIQPGFNYLIEISSSTTNQFYMASSDSIEDTEGEEYSKDAEGAAGEFQAGIKFGKGSNKKFSLALGFQYLFVDQTYTDSTYEQHWVIRPADMFILFNYRLTNAN